MTTQLSELNDFLKMLEEDDFTLGDIKWIGEFAFECVDMTTEMKRQKGIFDKPDFEFTQHNRDYGTKFSLDYHGKTVDETWSDEELHELTLEKWRFIRDFITNLIANKSQFDLGPFITFNMGGVQTCGFCMRYFNFYSSTYCDDCPIHEATGATNCENTPHHAIENYDDSYDLKKWLRVVEDELHFIENLEV